MLPPDELDELAAGIAANGLNEPLVIGRVDSQWMLIDGRNRREACRIAGVTPAYRILDTDPFAYVMSANIHRRHMTQGQRAMIAAQLFATNNCIQEEVAMVEAKILLSKKFGDGKVVTLTGCRRHP